MKKISFRLIFFKKLVAIYFLVDFIFSIMYWLPLSTKKPLSFLDAWFLSSSALSGTGLSTITLSDYLNTFSEILVILEMQISGIGIMTIIGSLMLAVHEEMTLPQLTLIGFDQNQSSLKNVKKMITFIFLFSLCVEFIGFLLVYPVVLKKFGVHSSALLKSIFHVVSSFTHASLDLFGGNIYPFANEPQFLLTTCLLIILGGVGFPTVWELLTLQKRKKSLYTKVNLTVHFLLLCTGTILILWMEWSNGLKAFSFIDKLVNAFFLSTCSRNSGFSNVDLSQLMPGSLMLIIILMFIGGSPSSTASGIRTTTLAILIAQTKSAFQGKEDVIIFKKSLYREDILKAYLVFIIYFTLYIVSTFLILNLEGKTPLDIAFEVMSAITNTGFSTGITSNLSVVSKILFSILMMVGRIGMISFIYSVMESKKTAIKYSKESILIG